MTASALLASLVLTLTAQPTVTTVCATHPDKPTVTGWVSDDRGTLGIRTDLCVALARVHAGRRSNKAGEAAFTVAHEVAHVRGENREGWADCVALQTMPTVLVLAGMSRVDARVVSDRFREVSRGGYVLPIGCGTGWGHA